MRKIMLGVALVMAAAVGTRVQPADFTGAKFAKDGRLTVKLPARSIVVLTVK